MKSIALAAAAVCALVLPRAAFTGLSARAEIGALLPARHNAAQDWTCKSVDVIVRSETIDEVDTICAGAEAAATFLRNCRLPLGSRLTIEVTDRVYSASGGRKRGEYLTGTDRIRLVSLPGLAAIAPPRLAGTAVTLKELHASVAAHEVAHAIFYAHTAALDLPQTAHEYVADIAQIGTLPRPLQDRLLADLPLGSISSLSVFSHFLMLADPDLFAGAAYKHFAADGNRCAFLERMIRGDVHFPPISE